MSRSTMPVDMDDLDDQISQLRKPKWANLRGLVSCAETRLSKPNCISISCLGYGSSNIAYRLTFSDQSAVAATISKQDEEDFNPSAKQSEIATMFFVRDSGLYPDIPVPRVHAWDVTFTNPAGAPYVFMDYVVRKKLDKLTGNDILKGLDSMTNEEQMSVVKALASIQASLSKPVPFDQIGSLTRTKDGKFSVGPLYTSESSFGPFKSLNEYWRSMLRGHILHALEEWSAIETDCIDDPPFVWEYKPQDFSEQFQFLSALVPHFIPPPPYLRSVLHHPDFALHNILFDHEDPTKIVGVIDWGGAKILPLVLTAKFSYDLRSYADFPFGRSGHPDERWSTVPHDWASCGKPKLSSMIIYRGNTFKNMDTGIFARANVKRYYLRQYFSSCYAESLFDIHGDNDLARARLFTDAEYYLKFHEVISNGLMYWRLHDAWIKETYWRLRLAGHQNGDVVIGPNTYVKSVRARFCDLGVFEECFKADSSNGAAGITNETDEFSVSSVEGTFVAERNEHPTTEVEQSVDARYHDRFIFAYLIQTLYTIVRLSKDTVPPSSARFSNLLPYFFIAT
ncbi:hypothetical protein BD410DRAFT_882709 [Rickenella mellea]|uniref:Aminoglycoside phosphotransferase domain-containing protein n=1 Tax=Rickenella mellea TaxID=50990 RepID=A0A4Y7PQS8_9AGAM|nr:hypothetical protein BD410DRAFT_882709 [Rickenella mellea]